MKRTFICVLLVIALITCFFPVTAYATTTDTISSQIQNTYQTSLRTSGRSKFNGFCGDYTATQMNVLGITTAVDSRNGCDMFDLYKDTKVTSGGYNVEAYPASKHSLSDALNAISSNGTLDVYNIMVGYQRGSGENAKYGHSMFIHAIVNGTVYFSESFGFRNIGGRAYAEGEPISLSIADFSNLYINVLGYTYEGVVHFNKCHRYFGECTSYPSFGRISIAKNTYAKTLPCSRKTCEDSDDIRRVEIGEELTVTGMYQNSAGNFWYEVKVDGETGYVYAGDTTYEAFYKDATIKNVSAPTSLNRGSRFSIKGDISSEYCKITNVYGSIRKKDAGFVYHSQDEMQGSSYSLLNSKIDMALLFNELPAGSYYYEIDVTVPYYYSYDGKTLEKSEECFTLAFQEFTVK